jgi:hypothetical protein
VTAAFDGERLASDGGVLLLAQTERWCNFTSGNSLTLEA